MQRYIIFYNFLNLDFYGVFLAVVFEAEGVGEHLMVGGSEVAECGGSVGCGDGGAAGARGMDNVGGGAVAVADGELVPCERDAGIDGDDVAMLAHAEDVLDGGLVGP